MCRVQSLTIFIPHIRRLLSFCTVYRRPYWWGGVVNLFGHVTAFNQSDYSIDQSNCRTAVTCQNKFRYDSSPPVRTPISYNKASTTEHIHLAVYSNQPTRQGHTEYVKSKHQRASLVSSHCACNFAPLASHQPTLLLMFTNLRQFLDESVNA